MARASQRVLAGYAGKYKSSSNVAEVLARAATMNASAFGKTSNSGVGERKPGRECIARRHVVIDNEPFALRQKSQQVHRACKS